MRSSIIVAVLASVLASGAAAQTFTAVNKLSVIALNASDFEVIEARGEGARGMWCAAASYALTKKRMQRNHRIYVKTARGPSISRPGRKGVVFTDDARRLSQGPSKSVSVSTNVVGMGLPVAHAIQFCRDNLIEPEDILYLRKGN